MAYIDLEKSVGIGYLCDWYQNSIMDNVPPVWTDEHLEELLKDFIVIPKDTPTAEVEEVKHGRWEIVKGSNGKEKMVCTDCRHQQDLASTFTYCPNCGALIDGRVIHNG